MGDGQCSASGALDVALCALLVTPLVVAGWRGTWELLDVYAAHFPPWESCVIGTLIHVVASGAQEAFHALAMEGREQRTPCGRLLLFLAMRSYTLLLHLVTNVQWRGVWMLLDQHLGVVEEGEVRVEHGGVALGVFGACLGLLGGMRCLRNLNSPPFELCTDEGDPTFRFPNMFRSTMADGAALHAADVAFSVGVVGNLGIVGWRGLWLLAELLLSPCASLVLGYGLVAMVFLLQPVMQAVCEAHAGLRRLLAADVYMLVAVWAAVNVWRGIWALLDRHFLPGSGPLGLWLCHGGALTLLMALRCSNSLLVRGVWLDGEEAGGSCVAFSVTVNK